MLVAVVCVAALYTRRKAHMLEPWRRVRRSRIGMAALVVLSAYVSIGLLDSLHFRPVLEGDAGDGRLSYSAQVLSVLDLALEPLRAHEEKTYSAPFATHLYAKETIELDDDRRIRDYPRLQYGGAHLSNPEGQKALDIAMRSVKAVLLAGMLWLVLAASVLAILVLRHRKSWRSVALAVLRGATPTPWRVILVTAGVLIVVLVWMLSLSLAYHVFGTDKVGQDVLYQAFKSVRTGLVIGTLTTLVMLPFAILLGIMAGYFRGWVDDIIQYIYTTLNSIPGVLLIAASILALQVYIANHPDVFETPAARADARLMFLCLILGVTSWTGLCRLLRGEALKLRELEYIQAATAFGVGNFRILVRHILPNVMHIVLIAVVLDFSGLVLAEAVLSYVGVGVDPMTMSWGNMINAARLEMAREPIVWWSLAAAFFFMFILVLAANLFSDAVRDAFDPRLRKS